MHVLNADTTEAMNIFVCVESFRDVGNEQVVHRVLGNEECMQASNRRPFSSFFDFIGR